MDNNEKKLDKELTSLDNNTMDMSKEEIESALNKFKDILNEMQKENDEEITDEDIDSIDEEMVEEQTEYEEEINTDSEDIQSKDTIEKPFLGKPNKLKTIVLVIITFLLIIFSLLLILKKCDRKIMKLSVTFDTDGGSDISSQKIEYNDLVSVPIEPTKIGYIFEGWYLGDTLYDFNTPVKENIKLKAHWKEYELLPVSGIKIDQDKAVILPGSKISLVAYVEPFNAENKDIKWSSSNKAVATVDEHGKVSAIKEGKTIITAKSVDGGYKATCEITVSNSIVKVENISFNKSSITLSNDATYQLEPIIIPSNSTNQGIIWSSSDENVATVLNGLITAHNDGEATITATTKEGNKKANVVVYVKNIPLTGIKITGARDMIQGTTLALSVQFTPVNSTEKGLLWSSNNKNVITVDKNGVLSSVGVGTAQITVKTKDGKFSDSVNIKSSKNASVYNITLDKKELILDVGDTSTLIATVYPANAENKNVIWTSSDESVVKVLNGKVTALKEGTATIRAITSDGGYKTICNVHVEKKEPNYAIYISKIEQKGTSAVMQYSFVVKKDNEIFNDYNFVIYNGQPIQDGDYIDANNIDININNTKIRIKDKEEVNAKVVYN